MNRKARVRTLLLTLVIGVSVVVLVYDLLFFIHWR
jgi:hypothetical protein